jgi:YVTN family beta-propeller protein
VAVNPVTNRIYAVLNNTDILEAIDAATNVITLVGTGSGPIAVAVNPVTDRIYVANQKSNSVTEYQGNDVYNQTTIPVGSVPSAIAVNPATNKIYVADRNADSVTVIDSISRVTAHVPTGDYPCALADNTSTNKIYVANSALATVVAIDGATNTPGNIFVGYSPNALVVNPVTGRVYVASGSSRNVTVVTEAPSCDTRVHSQLDGFTDHSTTLARPIVTGKGVNRWSPDRTRIEGVIGNFKTTQRYWGITSITGGLHTDSVTWFATFGTDSLIKGENFLCSVALESNGATTNSVGLGTPFVGNATIYPLYRIDPTQTGVDDPGILTPGVSALLQNYPNPCNPATTIQFTLAKSCDVDLKVYDMLGREVVVLVHEQKVPGEYDVRFDGSGLASGVYFYRLQVRPLDSVLGRDSRGGAGGFTETRKLLLLQ